MQKCEEAFYPKNKKKYLRINKLVSGSLVITLFTNLQNSITFQMKLIYKISKKRRFYKKIMLDEWEESNDKLGNKSNL